MNLTVIKKADDLSHGTKVLRLSIGGIPGTDLAYLTYLGDLSEIQRLLQEVTQAFSHLTPTEEPPISADDGKLYA